MNTGNSPQSSGSETVEFLRTPQYIIEGIILRRMHEKRIEGYTLEMAREIAEALATRAQPQADGEAHASKIVDHKWLDSECIERGCQSLVWKGRYEWL